ncbi:MAG: hypothetical protein AB1554_08960 [Chloroflexota bacterium]
MVRLYTSALENSRPEPGKNDQLYDHADLAVTTDYRQVLGELLMNRLGNPNVGEVFPGFEGGELGVF